MDLLWFGALFLPTHSACGKMDNELRSRGFSGSLASRRDRGSERTENIAVVAPADGDMCMFPETLGIKKKCFPIARTRVDDGQRVVRRCKSRHEKLFVPHSKIHQRDAPRACPASHQRVNVKDYDVFISGNLV